MNDIPTPITDAECISSVSGISWDWVLADFARDLERQLAEVIEQRDRLIDAIDHILGDSTTFLTNVCIEKAQAALASVKGDSNE